MKNSWKLALCIIAAMMLAVVVFKLARVPAWLQIPARLEEPLFLAVVVAFVFGTFNLGALIFVPFDNDGAAVMAGSLGLTMIATAVAGISRNGMAMAITFTIVAIATAALCATAIADTLQLKYRHALGMLVIEASCLYGMLRLRGIADVGVLVGGVVAVALLAKFGEKRALRSSAVPAPAGNGA